MNQGRNRMQASLSQESSKQKQILPSMKYTFENYNYRIFLLIYSYFYIEECFVVIKH